MRAEATSQIWISSNSDIDASFVPSGDQDSDTMKQLCPTSTRISRSWSQMRIMPS